MKEMDTHKVRSVNEDCVDLDEIIGLGHKRAVLGEEGNDHEGSALGNRADGNGRVDCNLMIVNCLHSQANVESMLGH